jgi:hypothetical protein
MALSRRIVMLDESSTMTDAQWKRLQRILKPVKNARTMKLANGSRIIFTGRPTEKLKGTDRG